MARAIDLVLSDLRFTLRVWIRQPGRTALIVLALAVGLACNIAAFSLVRSLLLRPYPFPDLERLVLLRETRGGDPTLFTRLAAADLRDLQQDSSVFSELVLYRYSQLAVSGSGDPARARAFAVTPALFDLVRARPQHGRTLTAGDGRAGLDRVVVLSDGFWQRELGGDAAIVGRRLFLNGEAHEVVGIMPSSFNFPRGADLWLPLVLTQSESQDRVRATLFGIGRLTSDVTLDRAGDELDRYSRMLADRHPDTNAGRRIRVMRLREEQYEYTLPFFSTLQIAAAFVLLVAAADASGIFVTERLARRHELSMRLALGAARRRLQLAGLLEGIVLGGLAAAFAIPFSWWAVAIIREAMPRGIATFVAGWDAIAVDTGVLTFAIALALAAGLAVGAIANLSLPAGPVTEGRWAREVTARLPRRMRRAAVAIQLSVALVLLSAGASIIAGFQRVARTFDTFLPDNVLIMGLALPEERYRSGSSQSDFFARALDAIDALPGVQSVAAVSNLPASNVPNARLPFAIERRPPRSPAEMPAADLQTVAGPFFHLLHLPILAGRALLDSDAAESPPVVVISDTMARREWPHETAIGQRIRLGPWGSSGPWWTIVGVVADVKQNWFDPVPLSIIYVSERQRPVPGLTVLARVSGDPRALARPVRHQVGRIDPALAFAEVATLRDEIDDSIAPLRIVGALLLVFAIVTLTLAAIGVYGVVATNVARETREIGVRIALGAAPRQILAAVVGDAVRVAGAAIVVALPITVAIQLMAGARLFNLVSLNPATLVGLTMFLLVVAVVAAFVPARHAASVDPARSLRAFADGRVSAP